MENSKLTGILQRFSRREMTEFRQFLEADYFCVNQNVRKLYAILMEQYPHFKYFRMNSPPPSVNRKNLQRPPSAGSRGVHPEILAKKELFPMLFPNEPYNDKRIRYLLTDLTRLSETFLSLKAFESDGAQKKVLLARELAKRDCEKAYLPLYQEILEPRSPVRDADFYFRCYQAELDHLTYEVPRQKRKAQITVASVTSNLDKFYMARKLQLCCEIYNVQNIMQVDHRVLLLEELLAFLEKNPLEVDPVISIYYRILMTLMQSTEEHHFTELQQLLLRYEDRITIAELRDMYQYVLNYCIKKINLGNLGYQQTLFETYKTILHNKVILTDGYLSQWDYKNICTISFRLKEFEWANHFIEKYHLLIRSAERENAFVYNKAYLHFHMGEFNKSLNLLQKVNFTDLYYQIDTRAMLLKIYYELDDAEALRYHLQAFKNFLSRNKLVSAYQRTIYSNLVKYTWKLVLGQSRKSKLARLHQEIAENRSTADLQWLLKKTGELTAGLVPAS